jgi:dienelactone hydrolase
METTAISYEADGREMIGTLVLPDGTDARPGVLVAHEGNGLTVHTRTMASRLAEIGYVAFALDYLGGGAPLPDRDAINSRLTGLIEDADRTRAIARAGLAVLLAEDRVDKSRIAAIGFCFGGTMVLELARDGADVKAVVGFHSGLFTARPEDAANIRGKVLVCIGAEDPLISPEERSAFEAEMRAGGVDWRMNLYGGAAHSFTNPDAHLAGFAGIEYHEPTAMRSWRAMIDLFDETLA